MPERVVSIHDVSTVDYGFLWNRSETSLVGAGSHRVVGSLLVADF